MTADERTEAEVRADRALRRGELSTALSLYQAVAAAFPDDPVIALKLSRIRETLQPMELSHAKTRPSVEATAAASDSVEAAEAFAAKGDHASAIAIYRRALEKRPDNDLLRERLTELFQIAQSMAPSRPAPSRPLAPFSERPTAPSANAPTFRERPTAPRAPIPDEPARVLTADEPAALSRTPVAATEGRFDEEPVDADPPAAPASPHGPVSSPRMLSDLLDQISRRRRGTPPKG